MHAEVPAGPAEADTATEAKKSDSYSAEMNKKMGTSLDYRHEEGLNYNRVLPDLVVGSCLRSAEDVDFLADKENVKVVFCLQMDSDMEYFDLDINPIIQRCKERGDVKHVRVPVRDFDPFDLRKKLPAAVSRLAKEHDPSNGTVYIHCTAGLGRAPATALAYMNWVRGIQLDAAFEQLLSVRLCGPKIEAIRSATADMLLNGGAVTTSIAVHRFGFGKKLQIAGLDYGWNEPMDMEWDVDTKRFILKRDLHPGIYQWKLIVDGHWTYSADHPTIQDGNHTNNQLEVVGSLDVEGSMKLARYTTKGSELTSAEKAELLTILCPWKTEAPVS